MKTIIVIDCHELKSALESEGCPKNAIERVLERVQSDAHGFRPHSSMTPHEAQDWLAANDPAGADYWRSEPLTADLIATVGEHLQATKTNSRLIFDSDWQQRYESGKIV